MGDAFSPGYPCKHRAVFHRLGHSAGIRIAQRAFIIAAWAISAPYAIWLTVTL
jgi:hypothetical protein